MAKDKTAKELKEEANKVMENARRQHALLMKKATEIEDKKFNKLGKMYIDFLNGEIAEADLKNFAVAEGIMKNDKKSDDVKGDKSE